MREEELVGNEGLKARLRAQTAARGLSHAYLISGPEGSGKHTLARVLAAAFLCGAGGDWPCGTCQSCRKVKEGIHPDVRQVKSPAVGEVRALRKDVYLRPNEGSRKITIIEGMETVNPSAQNALLKVLEEGPEYAVFLLLTQSEEQVLETVRSRCETLRLSPVSYRETVSWLEKRFPGEKPEILSRAAERCGGILGRAAAQVETERQEEAPGFAQADRFFHALVQGDQMDLLEASVELEGLSREGWSTFLQALEEHLQTRLPQAAAGGKRELARLLSCFELLRTMQTQVDANVGAGHCGGLLYVLCTEAMEKGAT